MVAPIPAPVTCGGVAGVIAPWRIVMVAGDTVTLPPSPLTRLTVKSDGAGAERIMERAVDWPSSTVVAGMPIWGITTADTFTVAVALWIPVALAVIMAEPAATPLTDTVALVAPAAKLTVEGTVALVASLELRLTVNPPAGACPPERFSVKFPVPPGATASGDPAKLIDGAGTVTVPLADARPVPEAVMVADPMPVPVTWGCAAGAVAPAAMKTLAGTVTLAVSLLLRLTVTPPAGAAWDRVTANAADWPRFTDTADGTPSDKL